MSVDVHCIRTARKTSSLETSSGELTSKAARGDQQSPRHAQGSDRDALALVLPLAHGLFEQPQSGEITHEERRRT